MSRAQAEEDDPSRSHLVGTTRFASIRGHQGQVQSPRDDLESLGYMLVFFRLGKLPWQGLPVHGRAKKNCAIMEKKIVTSAELLCEELHEEFAQYMQEVKDIPKGVRPLHGGFRQKLRRLANREGVKYDNVYDWTIRRFS
ncbi:casein kinase I [Friedmanniomyces endolithicus]|nr:casein kinase I [Friedmanniomyces endolithicus]KAK0276177.1 casein kinase I [Friedmanniomyces endolithicus]